MATKTKAEATADVLETGDPQLAASTSGHRPTGQGPRSPSPSPSMDEFREPDDSAPFSALDQHRFNKSVFNVDNTHKAVVSDFEGIGGDHEKTWR